VEKLIHTFSMWERACSRSGWFNEFFVDWHSVFAGKPAPT
jgi:hypothetical protein